MIWSENLLDLFSWLAFFLFLGVVNLPLTQVILPRFSDRAYIFSKIIGLLLIAYFAFLGSFIRILPFSRLGLFILTAALIAVNFAIIRRRRKMADEILKARRVFLLEEIIFSLSFLFWSFVRSHNPDIHDLEKFMDFGFINSILRTEFLPPKDIWLSGHTINYYYFGHFVAAVVIKLLGSAPSVGYNLMLSLLFSFTFGLSFSIGYNLYRNQERPRLSLLSGLMTAVTLTLLGNMQVIYVLFKGLNNYWYPDATRFIPNTIHEFPLYSFVVADLHGHLLDLPLVLLFLLFVYARFRTSYQPEALNRTIPETLILGFFLALMYMTNAADALIYSSLSFIFLVIREKNLLKAPTFLKGVRRLLTKLVILILSLLIFSMPFQLTFKPFTEGISIAKEHSPFGMFLLIWFSQSFFSLSFVAFYFRQKKENRRAADDFVLLLIFFSFVLILIPEIIYFKDIYLSQPRANTMFKFAYQAHIIFSVVVGYTLSRLSIAITQKPNPFKILYLFVSINILEVLLLYPYLAITSAYGKDLLSGSKSLNGTAYLLSTHPEDYAAIGFINQNVKGQPTILEAVGDSYTDYARISANTGLPAVLGWPVHEWLWRKNVQVTDLRRADVERIYSTDKPEEAEELMKKYQVEYVYIGPLEEQKYPNLSEGKFSLLGQEIYRNQAARLYRTHPYQ